MGVIIRLTVHENKCHDRGVAFREYFYITFGGVTLQWLAGGWDAEGWDDFRCDGCAQERARGSGAVDENQSRMHKRN